MKKIALLIYPEFSIQEVSVLMYIFRWFYDSKTVTFSSTRERLTSEEGITILPEKTFEEFHKEEYHCLVVPGACDFVQVMRDMEVFHFLNSFKQEKEFVLGAICGGPMLLSMAGLLEDKKFTNSLFYEMNVEFSAIQNENFVCAPIVVDGNIVTATGDCYRRFAIEVARKVGFACREDAMSDVATEWSEDKSIHHISEVEFKEFQECDLPNMEKSYKAIKQHCEKEWKK